jgi:hypothetical protein
MDNPYQVGGRVLASRAQDGTGHEEAGIVDSYTLIIGEERRPMVCVEFADGTRSYLRADGEDVQPLPEPDEEAGEGNGAG